MVGSGCCWVGGVGDKQKYVFYLCEFDQSLCSLREVDIDLMRYLKFSSVRLCQSLALIDTF